jgi:hypothetical protein
MAGQDYKTYWLSSVLLRSVVPVVVPQQLLMSKLDVIACVFLLIVRVHSVSLQHAVFCETAAAFLRA